MTPTCPYCGAEMRIDPLHLQYNKQYRYKCFADMVLAPSRFTEEEALSAAMQRYVEPNRVLTLDEVVAWGNAEARPVYIELNAPNGQARMHVGLYGGVTDVSIAMYTSAEDWQLMPQNRYGERYRFWLHRPTDEERQSVAWEGSK